MRLLPEVDLLRQRAAVSQSYGRTEIIDFHTTGGAGRLAELFRLSGRPALTPFLSAVRELRGLRRHFGNLIRTAGSERSLADWLGQRTERELRGRGLGTEETGAIVSAVQSSGIAAETADFARALHSSEFAGEELERSARWIYQPWDGRVYKYVGPEAHRLLAFSRLLGLIPFATVQRLRTARVRSMGASVAASTLDLLVSLGAEDIAFADPGRLEPSNLPRMPGGMGSVAELGQAKAVALANLLYSRNPYGDYRALVAPLALGRGVPGSVSLDEFIRDADLVLEVIDQVELKVAVRERMAQIAPQVPILFLTDAGSDPSAGIERGAHQTVFGNEFSQGQRQQIRERSRRGRFEFCAAEYALVRGHVPAEAALQLLFAGLGLIPFWSQTAISSRESAALGAKLWLEAPTHGSAAARVAHAVDAPRSLLSPHAQQVTADFWSAFDLLMQRSS